MPEYIVTPDDAIVVIRRVAEQAAGSAWRRSWSAPGVALFRDGLDEVPPEVQGEALQVIDRDAVGLRVVLTSRPEHYWAARGEGRLYRAAVIEVLPVGRDQAEAFLLAEQFGDRRGRGVSSPSVAG